MPISIKPRTPHVTGRLGGGVIWVFADRYLEVASPNKNAAGERKPTLQLKEPRPPVLQSPYTGVITASTVDHQGPAECGAGTSTVRASGDSGHLDARRRKLRWSAERGPRGGMPPAQMWRPARQATRSNLSASVGAALIITDVSHSAGAPIVARFWPALGFSMDSAMYRDPMRRQLVSVRGHGPLTAALSARTLPFSWPPTTQ